MRRWVDDQINKREREDVAILAVVLGLCALVPTVLGSLWLRWMLW